MPSMISPLCTTIGNRWPLSAMSLASASNSLLLRLPPYFFARGWNCSSLVVISLIAAVIFSRRHLKFGGVLTPRSQNSAALGASAGFRGLVVWVCAARGVCLRARTEVHFLKSRLDHVVKVRVAAVELAALGGSAGFRGLVVELDSPVNRDRHWSAPRCRALTRP